MFFLFGGYYLYHNPIYSLTFDNFYSSIVFNNDNIQFDRIAFIIIMSYITGHIFSFIASITIVRYSVWTLGYPSFYLLGYTSHTGIFNITESKLPRYILRIITIIFIYPIFIFDILCGVLLKMRPLITKELDGLLKSVIKQKIVKFLNSQYEPEALEDTKTQQDWFRLIYHRCIEQMPTHYEKIQSYSAFYGFARTITLVNIIFCWFLLVQGLLLKQSIFNIISLQLLFGIISYILYVCFNKFYRKFTLEALMGIAVNEECKSSV
jgi:hypothetical protein